MRDEEPPTAPRAPESEPPAREQKAIASRSMNYAVTVLKRTYPGPEPSPPSPSTELRPAMDIRDCPPTTPSKFQTPTRPGAEHAHSHSLEKVGQHRESRSPSDCRPFNVRAHETTEHGTKKGRRTTRKLCGNSGQFIFSCLSAPKKGGVLRVSGVDATSTDR